MPWPSQHLSLTLITFSVYISSPCVLKNIMLFGQEERLPSTNTQMGQHAMVTWILTTLGESELLTTDRAFVHSLMEYCSPFWGGAPASHLALENKALLLLLHHRQVGGASVFYNLLFGLTPSPVSVLSGFCRMHTICQ